RPASRSTSSDLRLPLMVAVEVASAWDEMPATVTSVRPPLTLPLPSTGKPWSARPMGFTMLPCASRPKLPARVNTCAVPSRRTKKPCPSSAMSSERPVASTAPCVNSVRIVSMREPRPIFPTSPPASAESRSANSVRLPLNPIVLTFAMLFPITPSAAPLLMRPLRPVESAPTIAILFLLRVGVHEVDPANLVEREAPIADEEHRRVAGEVDAIDGGARDERDRERRRPANRHGGDVDLVGPVSDRLAVVPLAVEREVLVAGLQIPEDHPAHDVAVAIAHGRHGIAHVVVQDDVDRRRLSARDREPARVEVHRPAEQRHGVRDRTLRRVGLLADELVEPVVDAGELLEARELCELRREIVRLHGRQRVLVLE